MKFREATKAMEEMGWRLDRVKGSHYHYSNGEKEFIVPHHSGDMAKFIKLKVEKLLAAHRRLIKTPLYKIQQFNFSVNFNGNEKSEQVSKFELSEGTSGQRLLQ